MAQSKGLNLPPGITRSLTGITMSIATFIKSFLFADLNALKKDEIEAPEEKQRHSAFSSLSSESGDATSKAPPVVRYGNEDIFVFDKCTSTSIATVGIYLYHSGILWIRNPLEEGKDFALQYRFAMPDWQLLLGDWTGSGLETLGFYNPTMGMFMLWNTLDGGEPDKIFPFGPRKAGLIALSGDWDGDGIDTIGLYDAQEGKFILKNSNQGGSADRRLSVATPDPAYIPVVGDWTGEGCDKVGLYQRSKGVFLLKEQLNHGHQATEFKFSPHRPDWLPVVGDWNGDGRETIGLFDPENGTFYLATQPFQSREKTVLNFVHRVPDGPCIPFGIRWTNFSS